MDRRWKEINWISVRTCPVNLARSRMIKIMIKHKNHVHTYADIVRTGKKDKGIKTQERSENISTVMKNKTTKYLSPPFIFNKNKTTDSDSIIIAIKKKTYIQKSRMYCTIITRT